VQPRQNLAQVLQIGTPALGFGKRHIPRQGSNPGQTEVGEIGASRHREEQNDTGAAALRRHEDSELFGSPRGRAIAGRARLQAEAFALGIKERQAQIAVGKSVSVELHIVRAHPSAQAQNVAGRHGQRTMRNRQPTDRLRIALQPEAGIPLWSIGDAGNGGCGSGVPRLLLGAQSHHPPGGSPVRPLPEVPVGQKICGGSARVTGRQAEQEHGQCRQPGGRLSVCRSTTTHHA
jgi:hypothetical protein